jgi:hypothetical protein
MFEIVRLIMIKTTSSRADLAFFPTVYLVSFQTCHFLGTSHMRTKTESFPTFVGFVENPKYQINTLNLFASFLFLVAMRIPDDLTYWGIIAVKPLEL